MRKIILMMPVSAPLDHNGFPDGSFVPSERAVFGDTAAFTGRTREMGRLMSTSPQPLGKTAYLLNVV